MLVTHPDGSVELRLTKATRRLMRVSVAMLVLGVAIGISTRWVTWEINRTESLAGWVYVVERGGRPALGGYVQFWWHGGGPYPAGSHLIKRIVGVPGDRITVEGRTVFVNGRKVGWAKPLSRHGLPLYPIAPGVIPPGHYFVQGDHPDSMDSRYSLSGLVAEHEVIGRAYRVL